jgi:hypothetical protein
MAHLFNKEHLYTQRIYYPLAGCPSFQHSTEHTNSPMLPNSCQHYHIFPPPGQPYTVWADGRILMEIQRAMYCTCRKCNIETDVVHCTYLQIKHSENRTYGPEQYIYCIIYMLYNILVVIFTYYLLELKVNHKPLEEWLLTGQKPNSNISSNYMFPDNNTHTYVTKAFNL